MANNNTKTYVDEERLQQYVDAVIEAYKAAHPSWTQEELNNFLQLNVYNRIDQVTGEISVINAVIDNHKAKLDNLPANVTERLVNTEGQIVILNADKNKLTDDVQIITTKYNELNEKYVTVETYSRQIDEDVQAFKSDIKSKSYVEDYDFQEFKTKVNESSQQITTDIETTKGNITKLNTEVKENYVTKEESKDFATNKQVKAIEEYTSTILSEQNGIIDILTDTVQMTVNDQHKLSTEVTEFKESYTYKYDELNNGHTNLVSRVDTEFVPKSSIKFDKTSQELTISDVKVPLANIEINGENYEELIDQKVSEKTEDVKVDVKELQDKYNEAVVEINKRKVYEPDTSEDSWLEVEDNGNVMAANNMFGSWWNPFETTYGKKFKIKKSVIDDINENRVFTNLTTEYSNQINDLFEDFDYEKFINEQIFSELSLSVHISNTTHNVVSKCMSPGKFDTYARAKFSQTEFFENNFKNTILNDISTAVYASKIADDKKEGVYNKVKRNVGGIMLDKYNACKTEAVNRIIDVEKQCDNAITQFNNTITEYINDEHVEIESAFQQKFQHPRQSLDVEFLNNAILEAGFELLSDNLYDAITDKLENIDGLNITKERICVDKNVLNSSLSTHLNLKYNASYEYKTAMEKALDACGNAFNTIFCETPGDVCSWIIEKCKNGWTKTAAAEAWVEKQFKEKVWPVLKDGADIKIFGTSIPIAGYADILSCINTIGDKALNNALTNYAKNTLNQMTTYVLAALDSDITSDTDYSAGKDFTQQSIDTVSADNINYIQLHNFDSESESSQVIFDKSTNLNNYYLLIRENCESNGLKGSELKYAKLSSLNNIVVSNNSEATYIDIKINDDEYSLNLSQQQIVFKDSDTVNITAEEKDGNLVLQFHAHYSYSNI